MTSEMNTPKILKRLEENWPNFLALNSDQNIIVKILLLKVILSSFCSVFGILLLSASSYCQTFSSSFKFFTIKQYTILVPFSRSYFLDILICTKYFGVSCKTLYVLVKQYENKTKQKSLTKIYLKKSVNSDL